MIDKDKAYSLQVLLKQEGDCTTPINLVCSECVLRGTYCVDRNVWANAPGKFSYIKECIKELPDDFIFEMLL